MLKRALHYIYGTGSNIKVKLFFSNDYYSCVSILGKLFYSNYKRYTSDVRILLSTAQASPEAFFMLGSRDSAAHLSFSEELVRANLQKLCQLKQIAA